MGLQVGNFIQKQQSYLHGKIAREGSHYFSCKFSIKIKNEFL